ncbi:hypothetical protein BYT27DRAFT_7186372 [Phlegmacium glaucopus]|nr:hypothetical protein BYT27DRAFT_7186372 [Phlegmacium glaucopus]
MGDLPVTDYSETTRKEDTGVAEATGNKFIVDENEDSGDDSDEEPPPFPYEHRGPMKQPGVGTDERSTKNAIRANKQGSKSKSEEQELDELDKRATKAKADNKGIKKKT